MDKRLFLGAVLLLASCNSERSPSAGSLGSSNQSDADTNGGDGSSSSTMSLLDTTWEFDDDGKPTVITIDEAGNYIENRADGTHVVHGTYVQKDGKDCFTSALGQRQTSCWTAVPPVKVGGTASATSENGGSAVFKRVAYRELQLAR